MSRKRVGMIGTAALSLLFAACCPGSIFSAEEPLYEEETAILEELDSWDAPEESADGRNETETVCEWEETESAYEYETESSGETAGGDVQVKRIRFAENEKDIWDALETVRFRWDWPENGVVEDIMYDSAEILEYEPASPGTMSAGQTYGAAAEEAAAEYSDTNVRTAGIDEADIVKTDGKYLYILHGGKELLIVRADRENTELLSRTPVSSGETGWQRTGAKELFAADGKVFVITEETNDSLDENETYYRYDANRLKTVLQEYDVSDPEHPAAGAVLEAEGAYEQARRKDGTIYLFTTWEPRLGETCEESILLPAAGGQEIPAEKVILPDTVTATAYLVMAAYSPENEGQWSDVSALVSGSQLLYVSSDNIYAVNADTWSGSDRSEITKIRYEEGTFTGIAAGTVYGVIDDSFSLDEYKGNLRVLTSYWGNLKKNVIEILSELLDLDYYSDRSWVRHNALYVLGGDMRRIGRIADIAEGEEIKSARFFGDTAYFVTFERTDPLFTADLSDPRSPKLIGELMLPGFSAYLHPFGENRLLGLGYDADEQTGNTTGLKLSLFDTEDPANVKETARRVIPGITWCPAVEEYKAIFADEGRELVGFWCSDRYLVFAPDEEDSFELVLRYDFLEDDLMGDSDYSTMRGLYIGDEFYLAGSSFVLAFDMNDEFRKDCILKIS